MAYSTQSDIEKTIPPVRLAELTDDTNGAVVDTDILDEQIDFADSLIDTYLRGKHTVPLTAPVPDTVRKWSVILTIYNCYERRIDLAIPETLQSRYDIIISQLKLVQKNKLIIKDEESIANTAGYYKTNKTASSRIFTVKDDESGVLDQYFSKHRITPFINSATRP